jgi:glycosyltransferase involved in cell wall biosynthesis
MSLSLAIIIPAYNEETAIAAIIERTLAARPVLIRELQLDFVEIIVVDDGSTDATAEIAERYHGIRVIRLVPNQGYGAAIKAGFNAARGNLLAFLDADGTCDPLFFVTLGRELLSTRSDIVIGSRLGGESSMPTLRRAGNRLFAGLLRAWGGGAVSDSASGMRILRRAVLPKLYPLPDGMHFTPAMSSLALFDPHLRIAEVVMPYHERTGASKLKVMRDGIRFLRIIVRTALTYRPLRFLGLVGALLLIAAVAYGFGPSVHYLSYQRIEEWMIYRLVAVAVAATCGTALIAVGVLAQQAVSLIHADHVRAIRLSRIALRQIAPWGGLLVFGGVALNWGSLIEYWKTGRVTAHWIYVLTGGLLVTLGVELLAFGLLARILDVLQRRRQFADEFFSETSTAAPLPEAEDSIGSLTAKEDADRERETSTSPG